MSECNDQMKFMKHGMFYPSFTVYRPLVKSLVVLVPQIQPQIPKLRPARASGRDPLTAAVCFGTQNTRCSKLCGVPTCCHQCSRFLHRPEIRGELWWTLDMIESHHSEEYLHCFLSFLTDCCQLRQPCKGLLQQKNILQSRTFNVGKTIISHPQFHHFYRWYGYHSQPQLLYGIVLPP